MFIGFDTIHERDRRTDGHRMTAIAALMHSIARQKNTAGYVSAAMTIRTKNDTGDTGLFGDNFTGQPTQPGVL